MRTADEDVEAVIVEAHARGVADQARGYGVEHLAQAEPAGRGDAHADLLVVARAPLRQSRQDGTLAIDALGLASVAASDELVDEGAINGQVGEVGAGAQQERVGDGPLEVPVRTLDRAVLVGEAGVVTGGRHAVVGTQGLVAAGEILLGGLIEVAEGGREAVGAVLARHAAERPEGILQSFGERYEALAGEHDVGVLEAVVGEPEVVEPMVEAQASDGDAEIGHVGKVRQSHPPGLVGLTEDDVLVGSVHGAPGPDTPLQGAAVSCAEIGMTAQDLFKDGYRPQTGRGLEQWYDVGLEHLGEGIGPTSTAWGLLGRGQAWIGSDAMTGGGTEGGLGLSGISCGGGHSGPEGGSRWHDAKHPASLTRSWTSSWPGPIRRRPSRPMACWTS
ncbi:hypothetical protein SB3_24310 [Methylobacterium radiotolerans]|nr:hypothetical protein SB3_24310 [Methylobacterium radiotolerans]